MNISELLFGLCSYLIFISVLFILIVGIVEKFIDKNILKSKLIANVASIASIIVIIFLIFEEIHNNDSFFIKHNLKIIGYGIIIVIIFSIIFVIVEDIFKKITAEIKNKINKETIAIAVNKIKIYRIKTKYFFKKLKKYLFKLPYPLPEAIVIFFVFKILNFTYYKIIKKLIHSFLN